MVAEREQSIQDFACLLNELDGGKLRDEASKKFADLMQYLHAYALDVHGRGKGCITLKLRACVDHTGIVSLDGEVEAKQPKPLRGQDSFYVTKRGGLSRNNPKQVELPLREVKHDPHTGEVREPGARGAHGE
jgi:hypothetical protein